MLRYRVQRAKVWLSNSLHEMPYLPFNVLSQSDCMMNACAHTALDFGNGNNINSGLPSEDLDITGFREAGVLDSMISDNLMKLISMYSAVTEISSLPPSDYCFTKQSAFPREKDWANSARAGAGGGGGAPQGNRGGRDKCSMSF